MTEELFRDDAYRRACEATVIAVDGDGIVLDRTVFYATGGGQPGDSGALRTADGRTTRVVDTWKDAASGRHVHVPETGDSPLAVGDSVVAEIDWERRYALMRMHTCLHLLCAVVPGAVTGGSVGIGRGRLDFDLPDTTLDKDHVTAELNRLIAEDRTVTASWIDDRALDDKPEMVRTLAVAPPRGGGQVRIITVAETDHQPCGGTHVGSTAEIGRVRVGKIEKKGRHNRRVNILLED